MELNVLEIDNCIILKIIGTIVSFDDVDRLREKLDYIFDSEINEVILDFSLCNEVGSLIYGNLLLFRKRFEAAEKNFFIGNLSETVDQVFKLLMLDQYFERKIDYQTN